MGGFFNHTYLANACTGHEQLTACSQPVLTLLNLIAALYGLPKSPHPEGKLADAKDADFIVVGAGTAGSVVAGKLAKHFKVVLLEAGGQAPEATEIPAFQNLLSETDLHWNFETMPNKNSFQKRPNGKQKIIQGKCLGGTMSMNLAEYTRGYKRDYDSWTKATNQGWAYKDILKAFKDMEDNHDEDMVRNKKFHSTGGPMAVERMRYSSLLNQITMQGARENGIGDVDVNANEWPGIARMQFFMNRGRYQNTFQAYVAPQKNNRKLVTLTNALVTKIEIDPKSKKAKAVHFKKDGKMTKLSFKKEVILTAGAINTPKILMNSGVGPKNALAKHNIAQIVDLPVGKNLMERITFDGVVFNITSIQYNLQQYFREHVETYLGQQTGPLASVGVTGFTGYISVGGSKSPNIQIMRKGIDVEDFFADPHFEPASIPHPYLTEGYMLYPVLVAPYSRGEVTLNPDDPLNGNPQIQLNALADKRDLATLVQGVGFPVNMSTTNAYKNAGLELVKKKLPGCESFDYGTDPYWECLIKSYTRALGQPSGTCKMGNFGAKDSVVEPDLGVRGLKGIRIMDASVIPVPIRADPTTATTMLASRGADIILLMLGKIDDM